MPTVLISDDDEIFVYALSKHLSAAGFDVTSCTDPFRALDALKQSRFDVLVTDIRFAPGQPHGFALARMAQASQRDLAVIYVTAFPDLAEAEGAPSGEVIFKPTEMDAIVQAIGEKLQGKTPKA